MAMGETLTEQRRVCDGVPQGREALWGAAKRAGRKWPVPEEPPRKRLLTTCQQQR